MRGIPLLALAMIVPVLSGCIAKTAVDVATAPVKAGSKAVDLATTSQSEADEKRGREIRQREEQIGKLQRRYEKEHARCADGDRNACNAASETYGEMQVMMRTVPVDPEPHRRCDAAAQAAARRSRSLIAAPMPVSGICATAIRGLSLARAWCRQS